MEIVVTLRNLGFGALVIHFARAIDVVSQALVEIALGTALNHLLLVIEFDFRNQQLGITASVVMESPLLVAGHFHRQFDVCAIASTRCCHGSWRFHGWCKFRRYLHWGFNRNWGGFDFRHIRFWFNLLRLWLLFDCHNFCRRRTLFHNRSYFVILRCRRV